MSEFDVFKGGFSRKPNRYILSDVKPVQIVEARRLIKRNCAGVACASTQVSPLPVTGRRFRRDRIRCEHPLLMQPLATIGEDRLGKSFQSITITLHEDISAAIFLEGLVRYQDLIALSGRAKPCC